MKFSFDPKGALAMSLACAGVSLPALADGVPAPRAAQHATPHRAAGPMTMAARKANDSGVALQYRVDGVAQVGRPIAVYLQFNGVTDQAGASVRFSTDAGLTLKGVDTLTLPVGQSTSATATLVSDREGLAYLNVFISQGGVTSAVSIPVQTGTAAPSMKPAGEMKSSADGEKIISLPATEGK